uniref:small monomeric GTPase n=1 Tax=Anopheles quadriannulatus TaxID=34691 RepID=A0A182X779_ANOQN
MVDGEAVLCEIWDTCPKGLMGTIIILSSTLYQAIEGEDGGPDRLLQSLVPVQERLEQVLHRIQAQEAQVHRSAAASYDRTARPRTSAAHLHTVCEPFAPPSSSTEQETGLHADVSSKAGQHLPGADPSFVVPPGWREITNLDRYLEETTGGTEESLELTEGGDTAAYGVSKRTQTTIVDRGEKVPFDPELGQSSPIVQGDGGSGSSSSSSKQTHGQTFTYHSTGPKRLLQGLMVRGSNNLLPQGTFAIRETSNYALPDGSFQRSTKTVAGPDVSIEENAEALSLTAGSETVQWADGLLLVYSITDRDSFNFIRRAKEELAGDLPVALVGNKVDMVHLRQVSTDEGEILAKDFECKFFEISAAEHVYQVAEAFLELCREVLTGKRKSKQSFIDKIDRMLSGSRTYSRGKSDSISPKE